MTTKARWRLARRHFALQSAVLGSICSTFANCSIHEHEPVLSDAGATNGGQLGDSGKGGAAGKSGSGGQSASAGEAGRANGGATSGGATAAGEGGVAGAPDAGTGASGENAGAGGLGGDTGAGGTATGRGGTSAEGGRSNGGASGSGGAKGGATGTGGAGGTVGGNGNGGNGNGNGGNGTGGKGTGGNGGATSCAAKDVGPEGASCAGSSNVCGPGESCCTSLCVPGGLFTLGGNVESRKSQARVSGFYLDKYEVSVGRFRKFVAVYDAWLFDKNPRDGAAKHPLVAGSGWQATAWASSLPASSDKLVENITTNCSPQHDGAYSTWSASGANDGLPINCLDWFEAFAFCAWDGGRLPTEAEWEYAAAGGDQGYVYPWGPQPPTSEYASYESDMTVPVGSKPKGAGRFGHLDLAGSVEEWVLDLYSTPYPSTMNDYAFVQTDPQHFLRVFRGSAWGQPAEELNVAIRRNEEPTARGSYIGVRCARPSATTP
ncbi:MAG TPA: SUMF1/EgtB/PvdO family nonheme iron enzyme [Polyangiaceae bacterium]|nr:SUMF1/EgtB/PvdO family nonheme iron enzyme [Polyangiaceae bacterium]